MQMPPSHSPSLPREREREREACDTHRWEQNLINNASEQCSTSPLFYLSCASPGAENCFKSDIIAFKIPHERWEGNRYLEDISHRSRVKRGDLEQQRQVWSERVTWIGLDGRQNA